MLIFNENDYHNIHTEKLITLRSTKRVISKEIPYHCHQVYYISSLFLITISVEWLINVFMCIVNAIPKTMVSIKHLHKAYADNWYIDRRWWLHFFKWMFKELPKYVCMEYILPLLRTRVKSGQGAQWFSDSFKKLKVQISAYCIYWQGISFTTATLYPGVVLNHMVGYIPSTGLRW